MAARKRGNEPVKLLQFYERHIWDKQLLILLLFDIAGVLVLIGSSLSILTPLGTSGFLLLILVIFVLDSILKLLYLLRFSFQAIWKPKNFPVLAAGYLFGVFSLITICTMGYTVIDATNTGRLAYGCEDVLHRDNLPPVLSVTDKYYFSATTFFSVGYGDICPIGASKYLAIFNMLIGNFFTVIMLAIGVSRFVNTD